MFLCSIQIDVLIHFYLFDCLVNFVFIICSAPWDQTTLPGYFKSAAVCLLCGPAFFIINFSFLPFFMGICAHYPQFRYFFRDSIIEIERLAKEEPKGIEMVKHALKDAVAFHNDVKE